MLTGRSTFRGRAAGILGIFAAGMLAAALLLVTGCGEATTENNDVMADTGGRLQIRETLRDFGPVPVGQKVEHKFALENTGTGPLSLGKMSVKRLEGC